MNGYQCRNRRTMRQSGRLSPLTLCLALSMAHTAQQGRPGAFFHYLLMNLANRPRP